MIISAVKEEVKKIRSGKRPCSLMNSLQAQRDSGEVCLVVSDTLSQYSPVLSDLSALFNYLFCTTPCFNTEILFYSLPES